MLKAEEELVSRITLYSVAFLLSVKLGQIRDFCTQIAKMLPENLILPFSF
jgi:hypothetical protein